MSVDTPALVSFLKQKLNALLNELQENKKQREELTTKIDLKVKNLPPRPQMTVEGFDAKIEELETDMATTTFANLQEEKNYLRYISDLRRERDTVSEYAEASENLKSLRDRRTELSEASKELGSQINDLRDALRKLDVLILAQQANPGVPVTVSDIITEDVTVAEEHLGRLIGKKGSGLREIETSCGVSIQIDDRSDASSTLRISGLPGGIARAKDKIAGVTAQSEETIRISPPVLSFLIANSGAAVAAFERQLDIRINVDRSNPLSPTATVRGLPACVAAFTGAVAEAEAAKVTMSIPGDLLLSVIGKSGANFKRIRDETGVEVYLERDSKDTKEPKESKDKDRRERKDTPLVLAYVGLGSAAAVARAKALVDALIAENTEHEVSVSIPRDCVAFLVADGGRRIQSFRKDYGVGARIVIRDELEEGSPDLQIPFGASGAVVVIRGSRQTLQLAQSAFSLLLADYERSNISLQLRSSEIRAVLGPGGRGVNRLRQEHNVIIDVDENLDEKKDEEEKKDGKKDDKKRRRNRAVEMGLPVGMGVLFVRGEPVNVASATAAVRAVISSYSETAYPVSAAVINALMRNKAALIHSIENETETSLTITKLDTSTAEGNEALGACAAKLYSSGKVRPGQPLPTLPAGVAAGGLVTVGGAPLAAQAALQRLAALSQDHLELLIPLNLAATPELLGPKGATIQELQRATGASIDLDKPRACVRVTGSVSQLADAEERIVALLRKFELENDSLTIDRGLVPVLFGKAGAGVKALEEEFKVKISLADGASRRATKAESKDSKLEAKDEKKDDGPAFLRLSGDEDAIAKAKQRILELCKMDESCVALHSTVPVSTIGKIVGRAGANLSKIEKELDVHVNVDSRTGAVTVRGHADAAERALAAVRVLLREAERVEVSVPIPNDAVKLIIGAGGASVRELEAAANVSIDLPRDRSGSTVTVTARGSTVGVQKAEYVLAQQALRRFTRFVPVSEALYKVLSAPSTLQQLVAAGVAVFAPEAKEEVEAAAADDKKKLKNTDGLIVLSADSEAGVAAAALQLHAILGQRLGAAYLTLELPQAVVESIPSRYAHPSLLLLSSRDEKKDSKTSKDSKDSKDSQTEKEKEKEKEKVSVEFVTFRKSNVVGLTGPLKELATVAATLRAHAAEHAQLHATVPLTRSQLQLPLSASLKAIAADTGASVSLDRDAEAVRVDGTSPEPVAAALARVQALAADMTTIYLQIPAGSIGKVVGKSGATIKELQAGGVVVDISRAGAVLTISALTKEAADAVEQRITQIVGDEGVVLSVSADRAARLIEDGLREEAAAEARREEAKARAEAAAAAAAAAPDAVSQAAAAPETHAGGPVFIPGATGPVGKLSKNARYRANVRAREAAAAAASAAAAAPPVTVAAAPAVVAAPAPASVAAAAPAPAPAPVAAPAPVTVSSVPVTEKRVSAPPGFAPAPTTTTIAAATSGNKVLPGSNAATEALLLNLLGKSYSSLLGPVSGSAAAPVASAPVASAPAVVAPVAAPAPAPAVAAAAPAGWSSKSASSSAASAPAPATATPAAPTITKPVASKVAPALDVSAALSELGLSFLANNPALVAAVSKTTAKSTSKPSTQRK